MPLFPEKHGAHVDYCRLSLVRRGGGRAKGDYIIGNLSRILSPLTTRVVAAEVMDQPDLPPAEHRRALTGLARLNRLSRSSDILWRPIARLAKQATQPLRVLDLATGSGDVPLALWAAARRSGLDIELLGVDASSVAVATARQRAAAAQAGVEFDVLDVLHDPLPLDFDVVATSLFLHHLDDDQARGLLARMAAAARKMVLVNDLVRGRIELAMVWLGARLVTNSRVVHTDASLSVRAALTPAELAALAKSAGLDGARVTRRFPCRMLLEWHCTHHVPP